MIYLLSDEGRARLKAVAERPVLYAFDFDGILAKSSRDRQNVKLAPATHEWLQELAQRAPCAIVSGRALDDLRPRLKGAAPYLIGNHGVESPLTPPAMLSAAERVCLEWMAQVNNGLAPALHDAGVEIQHKRYSLTIHYRRPTESDEIEGKLVRALTGLTPVPRLILGETSVNVLPPGSAGKGAAALALMTHLRRTGLFFVGDDDTDEDVFDLKEGLLMGVRIGRPPDSHARYYLKYHSEIDDVLRFLVHRLDGTPDMAGQILLQPGGVVKPA